MAKEDNEAQHDTTILQDDEAELARMGYKQELKRDLSLLQVCR